MASLTSFFLIAIISTRLTFAQNGVHTASLSETIGFAIPVGAGATTPVSTLEGTSTYTSLSATHTSQPLSSNLPPASGSIKGMNYNAQAGYDWAGQFKIANSFGFSSARLYTMIEPNTTDTPIAALEAAARSGTSVLLGIWLEGSLFNELTALKSAMSILGLNITGLSCGSEDLYRNTQGAGGTSAANIVSCISQAKSIVGGKFPVGHSDTYEMWATADGITVADSTDFVGYNGYPYWEGKPSDTASMINATNLGMANITQAGITKPVWITETGWPVSGSNVGASVPSTQNAASFFQAVGCGMLFGKWNTWWYTLEDSTLAGPHFGVISGPGQTSPIYILACPDETD